MPHCVLTGEIHFDPIPEKSELIELSYFITQAAINQKIGVNLYCNLTDSGLWRYHPKDYLKEGFIPYEILDNPCWNECYEIFDTWRTDMGYDVANIENTGMTRVQRFLESLFSKDIISYITLYLEDMHGKPVRIYEYTIQPKDLCKSIATVPNDIN